MAPVLVSMQLLTALWRIYNGIKMDCLNPQQSNKHKVLPIFVNLVNIEGLCGSALLLRDPPKKFAVWTSPEAATHHPAVTWPLPVVSPTASSDGHQHPFLQQGRTHLLGRHWQPFLWRILPSISSEGHCHPFLQESSTCHLRRHLRPSPQQGTVGHFLTEEALSPSAGTDSC